MTKAELKANGYTPPEIIGDVYKTENGTIKNTITNHEIDLTMGGKGIAMSIEIVNDNTAGGGNDLYVHLNSVSNDVIIVRAGESKPMDRFPVTTIFLTNTSGATITYRVTAFGIADV